MMFAISCRNGADEAWFALPPFDSRQVCTLIVGQWCLTPNEVDQIFGLKVGEDRIIGIQLKFRRIE